MDVSGLDTLGRWTPFLVNPLEGDDFLANQGLYPRSLPVTKQGFYLHHAFSRYQLKKAGRFWDEADSEKKGKKKKKTPVSLSDKPKRLVLTAKFLKTILNPGLGLLLALDAYQPAETLEVYREKDGKEEKLATVVSLTEVDPKKKVLGKTIFNLDKKQVLEIKPGEMVVLQVDKHRELKIDFRLGAARVLGKKKNRVAVSGGKIGVVIDARGRPIEIEEGGAGWKQVKRWMKVFGG